MADRFLERVVEESLDAKLVAHSFISGGCINNTLKLETSKGRFFVKWKANEPDLFEKEKLGLELLSRHSPIRIPNIIFLGELDGKNYLLLEWIEKGPPSKAFWEEFGRGLAEQHRQTNELFGLDHNNHIGRLPQLNHLIKDWTTFFRECRIKPQLMMAKTSFPQLSSRFNNLFLKLPELFPEDPPSLLHGDLWSGNFMVDDLGNPAIFDPAAYYGHREMELAFTRMFGGFDDEFYSAYNEASPLPAGFDERVEIYNLYPLLVHLNLFGASYLAAIEQTLKKYQ